MKKPNIILIHGDQHRFDCLGCCGNKDIRTPNLDALAQEGVRYTEHYTVYPVCTPSRYSMLSGLYPHQHTAWSNESTLPGGIATFPKLLQKAGYRTAAVGKMHFSPTYLDVGFDHMLLSEQNGQGRYEDDYHQYLMKEGLIDAIDLTDQVDHYRQKASADYYERFGAFASDLDLEHHSTGWITRQALNELDHWGEGGNLMMVGYVKPHHPFDPPAPYSSMYDPEKLTLPPDFTESVPQGDYENYGGFFDNQTLTPQVLRQVIAKYYGCITQIDDEVGRIVAKLKEKSLYDNSLIIYTSDHGEYLGCHHMLLKSNFLYDSLARIPLLIKYPKELQRQGVDERISENIDLSATILSCCGIPAAEAMCGKSLLREGPGREFAFAEGQYGTDRAPCCGYMIRSKRYKLLVNGSLENSMYFDLEKDPWELCNEIENPAYQAKIQQHRCCLVEKMLFSGASRNHLDRAAPQMRDQGELNRKSGALKTFIEEKLQDTHTAYFDLSKGAER